MTFSCLDYILGAIYEFHKTKNNVSPTQYLGYLCPRFMSIITNRDRHKQNWELRSVSN